MKKLLCGAYICYNIEIERVARGEPSVMVIMGHKELQVTAINETDNQTLGAT